MSTVGYRPPYLSESALKALVLMAIEGVPGSSLETFHARFGHLERGISLDDVIHGLKREWKFERAPKFNAAEWQWKYRILTETVDGDALTIMIAVDTNTRTFEFLTRWKRASQ